MQYPNLKVALTGLAGTDEEVAVLLNISDIPAVQDIKVSDIKKYLIVTGKILGINASVEPAALLTVAALNAFSVFEMSDATNSAALNAQLDGLVAAGLLNESDKTYILSLGTTLTSLAEQAGLGLVTATQIKHAKDKF